MGGCCGSPQHAQLRSPAEPLPPNPKVRDGVGLLYLGSGRARYVGEASGLAYVVSERRRDFRVHGDDATGLLRKPFVILAPR